MITMKNTKVTAAVRVDENGKEFLDYKTIADRLDITKRKADLIKEEIPGWDHDNPIIRISSFMIDEIEQVS